MEGTSQRKEASPRVSKGLKRQLIFMVLLKENNRPTSIRQIQLLMKKHEIHFFGRGCSRAGISIGAIGSLCEDLRRRGWLESTLIRPPRYKGLSHHYHLPTENHENVLKVARYLATKMPRSVLESDYGDFLIDSVVTSYTEGILNLDLDHSSRETLKEVCGSSPSALKILLDPGINDALDRICHSMGYYRPAFECLVDYLHAARLTDIAEGKNIRLRR